MEANVLVFALISLLGSLVYVAVVAALPQQQVPGGHS